MFRAIPAGGLLRAALWLGTKQGLQPATDMADDLDARRAELDRRIAERQVARQAEDGAKPRGDPAAMGRALKMSSEFIAGVLVGAFLGWGVDQLAGTTPFGLIVFLLLGFCAGVLNVMRAAGTVEPSKLGRKP
jgi:ATP synthase protein I